MELADSEKVAVAQKRKDMKKPMLFGEFRVRALCEAVACRMMLLIIGGINIDEPFRISEYISAVLVSGFSKYFIDQPHVRRMVQIKDPSQLCKRTHEQVLYKVLQFGNRRLIRQRGIESEYQKAAVDRLRVSVF